MPSFLLGYAGGFYVGSAPLDGRPGDGGAVATYNDVTWSELDIVIDVNNNFTSEAVDTTTRSEAKEGWASEINTTKTGEVTTSIRWQPGNAQFDQMVAAWLGNTELSVLDLDQVYDAAGPDFAQGIVANMTVSFNITKPVKDIQKVDVTLKISSFPNWVTSDGNDPPAFTAT